jgi:hypothetical protein
MKRKALLLIILFFAVGIYTLKAWSQTVKGFAVVELFTSEGCSSCPPADEAVARIQKEVRDQPIYILAFHVDYWNRLGWKDVFSDAAYSERQNQYAEWMRLKSVYTPQVVVNGKLELVGSEEDRLRNAIREDIRKPASASLALEDIQTDAQQIKTGTQQVKTDTQRIKTGTQQVSLGYHADGVGAHTSVLIALVQKSATTQVKRGENAGATLSHVQIVRSFRTIALDGKNRGKTQLLLPAGLNRKDLEIIAFLQDNSTGEILAACRAGLG